MKYYFEYKNIRFELLTEYPEKTDERDETVQEPPIITGTMKNLFKMIYKGSNPKPVTIYEKDKIKGDEVQKYLYDDNNNELISFDSFNRTNRRIRNRMNDALGEEFFSKSKNNKECFFTLETDQDVNANSKEKKYTVGINKKVRNHISIVPDEEYSEFVEKIKDKIAHGEFTLDVEQFSLDFTHYIRRDSISDVVNGVQSNRITIYGDDGAGKSTFVKHYLMESSKKWIYVQYNDSFYSSFSSLKFNGFNEGLYNKLYSEYNDARDTFSFIFDLKDAEAPIHEMKKEEFVYYINAYLIRSINPDIICLDDFPVYSKKEEKSVQEFISIINGRDHHTKIIITTNREPITVANRILLDHTSIDLNVVFLKYLESPNRQEMFYEELNNGHVLPVFKMLNNNVCAISWLANYMRTKFVDGAPITFEYVKEVLNKQGELINNNTYEYYDASNVLQVETNSLLSYLKTFIQINIEELSSPQVLLLLCMAGKSISKDLFKKICINMLKISSDSFNNAMSEMYKSSYLTYHTSHYIVNPIIKLIIAPEFKVCYQDVFNAFMKAYDTDEPGLNRILIEYQDYLEQLLDRTNSGYDIIDLSLIIVNSALLVNDIRTETLEKIIRIIRSQSLLFSHELNRKLYYLFERTGADNLKKFECYYYIGDLLDQNKQYVFSSNLANQLLNVLSVHNPRNDSRWKIDESHFIRYNMGLLYSLILADSENIHTLENAYYKYYFVKNAYLKDYQMTNKVKGIVNSDIGALYLNLGKQYDDYSVILSKEGINSKLDCINKALIHHELAKDVRKAIINEELSTYGTINDIETLRDYVKSCDCIATDLYYCEEYDRAIDYRKTALSDNLVKQFIDQEPLMRCVYIMYLNIAGCYHKIIAERLKSVSDDEIEYCLSILNDSEDYFDKDTNEYSRVLELQSFFKEKQLNRSR